MLLTIVKVYHLCEGAIVYAYKLAIINFKQEGVLLNTKDFDTREAILSSGRQEFLTKGFDKASLRTICKNAQVTTGAFYSYFPRKEELFSAIIGPLLKDYYLMYEGVIQSALADMRNCEKNELRVIDFILDHREEFRLLFDCSAGTKCLRTL